MKVDLGSRRLGRTALTIVHYWDHLIFRWVTCDSLFIRLSGDRQLLTELRTLVSLGSINREPPNGFTCCRTSRGRSGNGRSWCAYFSSQPLAGKMVFIEAGRDEVS